MFFLIIKMHDFAAIIIFMSSIQLLPQRVCAPASNCSLFERVVVAVYPKTPVSTHCVAVSVCTDPKYPPCSFLLLKTCVSLHKVQVLGSCELRVAVAFRTD